MQAGVFSKCGNNARIGDFGPCQGEEPKVFQFFHMEQAGVGDAGVGRKITLRLGHDLRQASPASVTGLPVRSNHSKSRGRSTVGGRRRRIASWFSGVLA